MAPSPPSAPSANASASDALDRAIATLSALPAFDGSVRKALALVEDPESTTGAIAEVIELDESLAVNVLAAANAAQRSLRIPARTPRQAILTVGRNELHGLLHDAATYRFLDAAPGTAAARGALRLHAVDVARYARAVAERTGVSPDLAYLAGLVHDLGKLILPMAFDAAALEEISATGAVGRDLVRLERQRLGVDHAEAAGRLVGAWGLDADVTQAVALHHGGPTLFACPTPLVACVQLGDTIARMATGHITSDPQTDLALRKLGAWPAMIDDLLDELTQPQPAATELSSHLHELQREASTDDLTGVANRRAWRAALRTYLEEGRAGSVLVCDLDEFKQLNDTHGHQTGDAALALAAQLLGQHGLVGRLGGDEFGLFVPADNDPVQVATRILDALPLVTGSAAFGMSIGISRPAGQGRVLDELLAEADAALYRAKGAGKNRLASAADAA